MLFRITLSDGSVVTGAVQGFGGECCSVERVYQVLRSLRRRNPLATVYIKADWNPITNDHRRLEVYASEIVDVQEVKQQ
jgi:hypothetical protein